MANKTFSDWLAALPQATVAAGDLIPVVQGGVSKRAPAGQANGLATLDGAGKLVQPRRVLDVQWASGSTDSISTTSAVGSYVLPDPRISVSMEAGQIAIVHGYVPMYTDVVATNGLFMRLMFSADGGTSWDSFGQYSLAGESAASIRVLVTAFATYVAPSAGTYMFGISIGNPGGSSNVIYAHGGGYRGLLVMVVEI